MEKMKLYVFILFFALSYSYLIFPIEYLPEKHYKFSFEKSNITGVDLIKKIYYRYIMTKLEIGTPARNFTAIIDSDDDQHYLTSNLKPKISNEPEKDPKYFLFDKSNLLNESNSSTYKKGPCEAVDFKTYFYAEFCKAKEKIIFNQNHNPYEKVFEFNLVRNKEDNIPGLIGLMYNFKYSNTKYPCFVNELRVQNLIENNYWFFNFDKVSSFDRILQGQLIIGGLPHDIFPEKYKKENYIELKKTRRSHLHGAWKIEFDEIFVNDNDHTYLISNTVSTLNYEMYNIIGSLEFHFRLKENFMEDLLEQKKCFIGKFQQNIHYRKVLTFYYCKKEMKDFLYKNLNNIKFYSKDFNQIFELTKEEIFYEKGDYIYLMIIFAGVEFNFFSLGQMFTTKYNFVFNTFYKEVGFYRQDNKLVLPKSTKLFSNGIPFYAMAIIFVPIISIFIGLYIGKALFGKKTKKENATELKEKLETNSNQV
jgi:hypothetical protein